MGMNKEEFETARGKFEKSLELEKKNFDRLSEKNWPEEDLKKVQKIFNCKDAYIDADLNCYDMSSVGKIAEYSIKFFINHKNSFNETVRTEYVIQFIWKLRQEHEPTYFILIIESPLMSALGDGRNNELSLLEYTNSEKNLTKKIGYRQERIYLFTEYALALQALPTSSQSARNLGRHIPRKPGTFKHILENTSYSSIEDIVENADFDNCNFYGGSKSGRGRYFAIR